ncbi:RiboL-PSP-HEPN [compost metagenome]
MSRSKQTFQFSIKDAEELLEHFDAVNSNPPPPEAEVLKRAGLVMALTAWETYVEDRINEAISSQLRLIAGSHCGDFIRRKLDGELKRFHNPDATKTRQLFQDYLGVDVTEGWVGLNADAATNRKTLDGWISKRGQAVHRSKVTSNGVPAAHLVRRDDLEKAIRFVKMLVEKTDQYLEEQV